MKYLSAKEMAEKWGLSTRSVQYFCSCGRIPGAKNLGRQWIIPADAVRPSDSRTKSHRSTSDTYRFPLFIFSPAYANSDTLNPNEYALLSAQLKQLEGDYTKSIGICREVLSFELPCHVKIGAYYTIALCSMLLGNYYEFKNSVAAMEATASQDDPHFEDYKLMIDSIKRPIGWDHKIFDNINVLKLSSDALYLYQYEYLLGVATEGIPVSEYARHIFDALALQVSLEGIAPLDANIRFALASIHMASSDSLAKEHVDVACDICVFHNWTSLMAKNTSFANSLIKRSLDKKASGYYKKVSDMSDRDLNNWRVINMQESGIYPLKVFRPIDVSMLFMIYQGLSNTQICTIMGLSVKELQNALRNCYEAANVNNRDELKKYTKSQFSTWFKS